MVLKGSQARLEAVNDRADWVRKRRTRLIESGVLEQKESAYLFTEDYVFGTPSGAAQTVLGRPANGWTQWRNQAGKTLDELERQ